jgi:hypothetical protein
VVIVNLGEKGFFLEIDEMKDILYWNNLTFPGKPQSFPTAIDLTNPYKNFKEVRYQDRYEEYKQELVSMVDLTARISSNSQNILLVFDVVHGKSGAYYLKKRENPDF